MNVKTMEGLAGANASIRLAATPMSIMKEAERKGDTAKMQRAAKYAGDMVDQAEEYGSKAEEGMKLDAKEAKEREKQLQEKVSESRKASREEQEKRIQEAAEQRNQGNQVLEDGRQNKDADGNNANAAEGIDTPSQKLPAGDQTFPGNGAGSGLENRTDTTYSQSGEAVSAAETGYYVDVTV